MTVTTPIPLTSDAILPGVSYDALRMTIRHLADSGLMTVEDDSDARLQVRTALGQGVFLPAGSGVKVTLEAMRPDQLQTLRSRLVERLTEAAPEAAAQLRWSDAAEIGGQPANFRLVTVEEARPLGGAFFRVRISAVDFALFDEDSIHFRLLLPAPELAEPAWPWIAENGATRWPGGDEALHKPVYTARRVDAAAGEMTFDVFIHDGGRVTDWVRAVRPGTQVGLIGPGGGGIPATRDIRIFGDETAFPAIARIVETLPAEARGEVTLVCEDGADCAYPIPDHPGLAVTFLRRDEVPGLAELAMAERAGWTSRFLWLAGEKADAQAVRAAFKADGGDADQSYIAAYWSRPRATRGA